MPRVPKVRFVTLFKVFGLTLQMSCTKLMVAYRGLKVSLPAIMNKDSFIGNSINIFIDRSCVPVVRSSNISSSIILPGPEPVFLSKKLKRLAANIFPAFRTKTCTMFNNLIRVGCHLKSVAIMPWLSSCFTTPFFPKNYWYVEACSRL